MAFCVHLISLGSFSNYAKAHSSVYSVTYAAVLAVFQLVTGCEVAHHCCKVDQPFQWQMPNFESHLLL